jgi:hypothetical protein
MTTYVTFPQTTSAFSFLLTLDGTEYSTTIKWNLAGQRWYFNLYDLQNNSILTIALVASPDTADINLVAGYFNISTVVFRDTTQNFEINP